jgi:hypothetical protein
VRERETPLTTLRTAFSPGFDPEKLLFGLRIWSSKWEMLPRNEPMFMLSTGISFI